MWVAVTVTAHDPSYAVMVDVRGHDKGLRTAHDSSCALMVSVVGSGERVVGFVAFSSK